MRGTGGMSSVPPPRCSGAEVGPVDSGPLHRPPVGAVPPRGPAPAPPGGTAPGMTVGAPCCGFPGRTVGAPCNRCAPAAAAVYCPVASGAARGAGVTGAAVAGGADRPHVSQNPSASSAPSQPSPAHGVPAAVPVACRGVLHRSCRAPLLGGSVHPLLVGDQRGGERVQVGRWAREQAADLRGQRGDLRVVGHPEP